jgi:protein-ribulosamine 3-kinase
MDAALQKMLIEILLTGTGKEHRFISATAVGGGSINETYKVQTDKGVFFVKVNSAKEYPGMFEAEQKGLELLKDTKVIFIPGVYGVSSGEQKSVLVSEFVMSGARTKHFFYEFGQALARLHAHTQKNFGLDHDNYIGSLKQYNSNRYSWHEFFSEMRLEIQVRLARDSGKVNSTLIRAFERLYGKLNELFPAEPPALLHGDLWSGNYIAGPGGNACIFDPAVYFGHREMDLAMTKLFGGFDREFYEGYHAQYPLEKGWEQRTDICNLYPLLVHVNLFGSTYVNDVTAIVNRFR